MKTRNILMALAIVIVMIAAGTAVSADSIKTHEFNYTNGAFFNLSDNLTNDTSVELSLFDVGTSYLYPDENVVCLLLGERNEGIDDLEGFKNDKEYEKLDSNKTQQGYETYVFKNSEEYTVFIELDDLDLDGDGIYKYFRGTFKTPEEVQIFIDTFRTRN